MKNPLGILWEIRSSHFTLSLQLFTTLLYWLTYFHSNLDFQNWGTLKKFESPMFTFIFLHFILLIPLAQY